MSDRRLTERSQASAYDRTDDRHVSPIRTNQIKTHVPSSVLYSLRVEISFRLIIDTKAIHEMPGLERNKVYDFLSKLSCEMQQNSVPMSRIEFFLANVHCAQTYEYADELRECLNNPRTLPNLDDVIHGFGDTPADILWLVVTTHFKKKELRVEFPDKLSKIVILDYGSHVRDQRINLPNHLVLQCYANSGLPYIPGIVDMLMPGSRSSLDARVQSNQEEQLAEYEQDRDDFENAIIDQGYIRKVELGKGGYGTVYKYSMANGQSIAVKYQKIFRMKKEDVDMELEILSILEKNSFFVVVPTDHERTDTMLAQKFHAYSKGNLLQCVFHRGLDTNQKEDIMGYLARGLVWLRSQNVVHLDIKLCNILMNDRLCPTIADFGLSLFGPEAILQGPRGTPGFGAPEQWTTRIVNHRADIFGLGMVYYVMCNHRFLLSERQNKFRHINDFWSHWNPIVRCGRWSGLVQRMISVDSEQRPNADEVLAQLRNERNDSCFPFNLRNGDRNKLNGRATIEFVLSKYADVKYQGELKSASFSNVFPPFASCIGIEYLKKAPLKFVDAQDAPPSDGKEFMIKRKSGKKYEVRLYLSKRSINHYEVKEYFWKILKQITIALMIELGRHPDLDQDELSIRLDRYLSLF